MKIVHCIFSLNTGGAETMLIDILNEQVKTEDVALIIINESFNPSFFKLLDKRVSLYLLHRKQNSKSPCPIIKLNTLLFHLHPDVIHLHNSSLPAILLPYWRHRLFYTIHSLDVNPKYLNHVACTFAISNAVKEHMQPQLKKTLIAVVPNGISCEKIKQRENKSFDTTFKIIQVARLNADIKGQDILIRAIAQLNNANIHNITVDFIGEGPSETQLRELSHSLHVEDKVNFLGLKDRAYIYSHLKDYDLLCHPARSEGFGLVVAEAMAAYLPVLVSNENGPYEIINHGTLGFFFENENITDCAEQIEYIYHNYSQATEKAEAACVHIAHHYSIANTAQEYINHYKMVLTSSPNCRHRL